MSLPVSNSQFYTTSLTTISATPERDTNTSIISASNSSLTPKTPEARVLTEELTSKRPLRAEKDKERRLSRPASIATPTASMKGLCPTDTQSLSGADSSNRNSVDTTDSTSEEDQIPPPLPAKTRDSSDLTSLPYGLDWSANAYSCNTLTPHSGGVSSSSTTTTRITRTSSITNSTYEYVEATNFLMVLDDKKRPPTPPPKPSRNPKHIP